MLILAAVFLAVDLTLSGTFIYFAYHKVAYRGKVWRQLAKANVSATLSNSLYGYALKSQHPPAKLSWKPPGPKMLVAVLYPTTATPTVSIPLGPLAKNVRYLKYSVHEITLHNGRKSLAVLLVLGLGPDPQGHLPTIDKLSLRGLSEPVSLTYLNTVDGCDSYTSVAGSIPEDADWKGKYPEWSSTVKISGVEVSAIPPSLNGGVDALVWMKPEKGLRNCGSHSMQILRDRFSFVRRFCHSSLMTCI